MEVGSGPSAAAWIIKEGLWLRTKEERWRTWGGTVSEQHPADSQPEMTQIDSLQ